MKTRPIREHGFWDYTCPVAGGMEGFTGDDYLSLLDDMAAVGMNSLAICPKWMTTGYRSRLPYLDQSPANPVIASSNELLRFAIAEARKRKIKVWLAAVVNFFPAKGSGARPRSVLDKLLDFKFPFQVGCYDSDLPLVRARAAEVCAELVELFPGIGGLVIELENDNIESPRRIPLYNKWAAANKRRPFQELGHPFNPRYVSMTEWRDYTTHCRLEIVRAVERETRKRGFRGDLALVCGMGGDCYEKKTEVNYEMLHKHAPGCAFVAYWYENNPHQRFFAKEMGIAAPRMFGVKAFYLPRGVMTWGIPGFKGLPLEKHWQMDVDDAGLFRPDGLWWFGCGTVNDGVHVSLSKLRKLGYRNGAEARRSLLRICRGLRACCKNQIRPQRGRLQPEI
ncbi:MAG: hypothetical protein WC299_14200 [Kiritimatiellia bacterium]